ncbi:MAG: hypothetical protein ACYTXY_01200 [Nostoc sp.]
MKFYFFLLAIALTAASMMPCCGATQNLPADPDPVSHRRAGIG